MLPTDSLQSLTISPLMPWADLEDSISSVVLRCGPSLMEFVPPIPLSDAAINHLLHLPHLHTWHIEGPPPSYSPLSLPPVFPPLTEFTLGGDATRGWFSLFERLERSASATQGMAPLSKVKESLESLDIENLPGSIIDASFTSTIQIFWNLVHLGVEGPCHDGRNNGQCTFKLNNDNVTDLAVALPRLEYLLLGHPCFEKVCATTVACLLPMSVHCTKLQEVEIHFNTTNIVEDFKNILADPQFQELHSLPKCTLSCLNVAQTPLTLDEPGFEIVANGIVDIFPGLGELGTGSIRESRDFERYEHYRHVSVASDFPSPGTLLNHK